MSRIIWKTKSQAQDEELLESLIPSKEEVLKAETELQIINILMEVELI